MTRPNKHAARFGSAYRADHPKPNPLTQRFPNLARAFSRCAPALAALSPVVRHISEAARRYRELTETNNRIRDLFRGYTSGGVIPAASAGTHMGGTFLMADVANPAAPTLAELSAGAPIRGIILTPTANARQRSPEEFVEYADDVLTAVGYDPMYPEPHEHTDEPWPYRSF